MSGHGRQIPGRIYDRPVAVRIQSSLDGIDWDEAKADLAADDFDNGRSAEALRRSFAQSQPEFWSRVSGSWLDNDANR
jgi:hypothetical protein